MKHKALLGALGLSLLFNVFVLVGFVQSRAATPAERTHVRTGPAPVESRRPYAEVKRMARDLQLDEKQTMLLAALQDDHRLRGQVFDQSHALLRQALREELRQEEPDLERVRALLSEEAELFRQRRMSEANLFGRFMGELSPEQRTRLNDRFRRATNQPPPIPPKILDRFDVDRDGRLNRDEMREARRAMDERRRELSEGNGHHAAPSPH